ncbi:MAG: hypothetical protein H6Q69_2218 [Firmicutes bacterium]|nr:hypothetical protein [Bacillota bacterium]
MMNFHNKFSNFDEVHPKLTWSHYILSQINDDLERMELYFECIENNRNSQWLKNKISEKNQSIELLQVFYKANQVFLCNELDSIVRNISERSLCAHMMCYLKHEIETTPFKEYFVDVEYNRNDTTRACL